MREWWNSYVVGDQMISSELSWLLVLLQEYSELAGQRWCPVSWIPVEPQSKKREY